MRERLSDEISAELVVYCEDVREEMGGKFALLGVITADIYVAEFPAQIRVAFLIGLRSEKPGKKSGKLRLMIDDSEAFSGAIEAVFTEPTLFSNTVVPTGLLSLTKPGVFRLLISFEEDKWVEIIRRRALLGPPP